MATQTLWHVTTVDKLASIRRGGLDPARSKGKRKAVWLVPGRLRAWAVAHVLRRHKADLEWICLIPVRVPRAWLRRHKGGTYYTDRVVPVYQQGTPLGLCPLREV